GMSAQQQYGWYWFEKILNLFSEQPAERGFLLGVLVVCGIASVVLSGWCIYIDDVINNDGVEYIRTAERLAVADWTGALSAYKWPFFPFLILLSSKILSLSYSTTGYLLNTIFFTITIVFFVLTVREFGGYSRRLTLLAATVALVHPAFNEYRAFIIRDSGYLASLLVAMYCLARVGKVDFLKYRAGVVAGFAVASLFRVEGFVFLLFTPLLLAVIRGQHNVSPGRMLLTVVVSA
ncbi:uncharacterized protein METZ01_LOCUS499832, partial [marine metagenome]